ncbi:siderophore-interacting protein [Trujillonella endophytica]|uniref:NADPH-dependent ferric siderophore reductase, contains FAD-binding and SIP domains n=1 Tax=Trujillonella endophytica TaxID=673521 RepID=A0A1H8UC04_9ACTN|nr:siderophore-interacting protein [Trujillella endophytica]SEP00721.1 NADPH-dependent ferric siderophore reductase, contains FAD-binding and SIP domains [Trujillella endophytica]
MTTTVEDVQVADPVEAPGWRFYDTVVTGTRRLGPSIVRLTLGGPELAGFGAAGDDQRIKFVLPRPGTDISGLMVGGADWYAAYCAMPDEVRPFLRTYTVRAARPDRAELDVDVVLHGVGEGHAGPAAAWAAAAVPGDRLVLLGPDRPGAGRMWGVEWAPPATAHTLLLAADETAVPAVGAILECLAPGRRVVALLEIPEAGDAQELDVAAGVTVRWLPRAGRARGELLVPAVHAALCELGIVGSGAHPDVEDVDVDAEPLWEVPDPDATAGCYAWLAGEAGVVKQLRRHLVTDLGVPRNEVAFMGYWRLGVAS